MTRRVLITQRTATRFLNMAADLTRLADRFDAVGSYGRADELMVMADTLNKIGTDLQQELNAKDTKSL